MAVSKQQQQVAVCLAMATISLVLLSATIGVCEARARRASTGANVQVDKDGCHMECPRGSSPGSKQQQQRDGSSGSNSDGQSCRWILRTDGKSARLCEPANKCKKVCPKSSSSSSSSSDESSSSSERIEQQTEPIGSMSSSSSSSSNSASASSANGGGPQSRGIMQHKYGNKLKQAPVPGVSGGRLANNGNSNGNGNNGNANNGAHRQMAPTLAPEAINYDDTADTPPPIARFLDISPEE